MFRLKLGFLNISTKIFFNTVRRFDVISELYRVLLKRQKGDGGSKTSEPIRPSTKLLSVSMFPSSSSYRQGLDFYVNT